MFPALLAKIMQLKGNLVLQNIKKNIALIGMMACSKTTSGKLLSQTCGFDFFDSDEFYVLKYNQSIPQTFALLGESVFRERETCVLSELSNKQNAVISCGGGIVLKQENRDILKQNFFVVELTCDCKEIYNRVKKDGDTRPLLSDLSVEKIENIYNCRKSFYSECASISIDTTHMSVQEIVDKIYTAYNKD